MKGFTKLTIQIAVLSISMIALSFLTDTDIWLKYFNEMHYASINNKTHCMNGNYTYNHSHWNYRGWVYVLSGLLFFVLSVVKIFMSHKEEDFK